MKVTCQATWGDDILFATFRAYDLPDGIDPIVDMNRAVPVYGYLDGNLYDGRFVHAYLAPVGNGWTLIMQRKGVRYYLLYNQPETTAYAACEDMYVGQGSSIMAARRDLRIAKALPEVVMA